MLTYKITYSWHKLATTLMQATCTYNGIAKNLKFKKEVGIDYIHM